MLKLHRKQQWDLDDMGIDTVLACHMTAKEWDTRLFSLGRYRATGVYVFEFGGKFAKRAFRRLLGMEIEA